VQLATVHTPDEHAAVAFGSEHAVPHAPQFDTLVWVFVSQPLAPTPSQLPQPATQEGTQAPAVQVVVPWAFVQAAPQAPQLETLVWVFVSQPLLGLPSQLAYPAAQAPSVHVPPLQDSAALARSHGTPQPPQSVSVLTLLSQPLLGLPSQLA
jgi:hypothetical protein